MTTHFGNRLPQFYITAPQRCPYLPDRFEKKIFTHLLGGDAVRLNDTLTNAGFRRSQNIAYKPACDSCHACVSVRIVVDEFRPGRTFRRILNRNADVEGRSCPPEASAEQYVLLKRYLDERHAEGGMADMTALDYVSMVEDTTVNTRVIEYRRVEDGSVRWDSPLVAVALSDIMGDGLSMVYSFFDPAHVTSSLGTYVILDHIRRARNLGLPYVYLGFWVAGSEKMSYKTRFRPLEILGHEGWQRLSANQTTRPQE